ncbi:MAG: hypothetical protein NC122_06800 [Faecalibacterium sp.]|nr:hypothetical protein [Ruminococcus sp.]MCM1392396.1 hypothetical protein [Ruminococcus sp.]MCM1485898.1 hypothetical protein [Faecalibacterium sp.]
MADIIKDENAEAELAGRLALTDSIKLRESVSEGDTCDFAIEGTVHAGASCICYKATRYLENGDIAETGTLKEFYPVGMDSYKLKRRNIDDGEAANQLYANKLTLSRFLPARESFIDAYKKIAELKRSDEQCDNFFSPINIYRGIPKADSPDNYTVYIWTPGDNTVDSFSDYVDRMFENIKAEFENPSVDINLYLAEQLRIILHAMKALAIGIEKLHFSNCLHLDITPSNFGIRMIDENDADHITVSLFDINSIYPQTEFMAENPAMRTAGTYGFRAPEMIDDTRNSFVYGVSEQSDIYSLGATLYNAIILSDDGRQIYNIDDFNNIDTALSRSRLIEPSEFNSKSELHDILALILKRSLARKSSDCRKVEPYTAVGEFIEDIKRADDIVTLQVTLARQNGAGKKVITSTVDKETYYNENTDTGAQGAVQSLLFDKPLYDYAGKDGQTDILVLGCGVYAQKFIDTAFAMAQIKGCRLNITVITNEKEKDEARYLSTRPEFCSYFEVNGKKPMCGDYGSIRFLGIRKRAEFTHKADNAEMIKDTLKGSDNKFSYVFISLSDDNLNKKVAEDLSKSGLIRKAESTEKAIINFIRYDETADKAHDETESLTSDGITMNPVAIRQTLSKHKEYGLLRQMAFNCHLLWGNGLNIDMEQTYADFKGIYNFSSSLSNALSIKYKLHSIGIEFDELLGKSRAEREMILAEITEKFKSAVEISCGEIDGQPVSVLDELTMYEHRRWIVNSICSSWQTMSKEEYASLETDNKDKRNLKHPCIVPSKETWSLNSGIWRSDLTFWDRDDIESTEEFSRLDELDKMSVRLHGHFMRKAKKYKIESMDNDARIIKRCLADFSEALAAFNALLSSMRAIITSPKNRDSTVQETYRHCTEKFKEYLTDSLPNVDEIKKRLKNIEKGFAPVRMAYDYTDFKAKDQMIIKNIPFILNYSTSLRLCIPFVDGVNNNEWFSNAAAPLMINPSAVTYLVKASQLKSDMQNLIKPLSNITKVLDSHSSQARISLIIYTDTENILDENSKNSIIGELTAVSERIYNVDIIAVENLYEHLEKMLETNRKSAASFDAIEANDTQISQIISDICDENCEVEYPRYTFNSESREFTFDEPHSKCGWLADIPFNTHLSIDDLFILQNRLSVYNEPEMHNDYETIWDECYFDENESVRAEKVMSWQLLCRALKEHTKRQDLLADIDTEKTKSEETVETVMFVPMFCKESMEKILTALKDEKVQLITESVSSEYNSATIRVCFKSSASVRNAVSAVLQNPYALMDPSDVKILFCQNHVQLIADSLTQKDFSWSGIKREIKADERLWENAKAIFDYLVKKGYLIRSADKSQDKFDFVFCGTHIKELLTDERNLLELYVYYKTLENGCFDQVNLGFGIKLDEAETPETQQFDMIAIKGFRTFLIEISDRKILQPNFYAALKSNGEKIGINEQVTAVSGFDIGDCDDFIQTAEACKENCGIDTIYETSDITAIGQKLAQHINQNIN